ncbi:hypothetical protein C7974DRAFT_403891, partial [Boeremia exigua]|uniref:uncharacterized protein n=1 Tax=Boeremia exigua TaxID=749465 RepID=UPI001E8E3DFE
MYLFFIFLFIYLLSSRQDNSTRGMSAASRLCNGRRCAFAQRVGATVACEGSRTRRMSRTYSSTVSLLTISRPGLLKHISIHPHKPKTPKPYILTRRTPYLGLYI